MLRALLLSTCVACGGLPRGWTEKRWLQTDRQDAGVVAADGRMFVAGGRTVDARVVDWLDVYDPSRNAWTRLTSMPAPRHHPNVCAHGGKVYVIGGLSDAGTHGDCWRYDLATTTWNDCAPLPEERGAAACVTVGDTIYVLGGVRGERPVAEVSAYTPATDSWRALPPLPAPRSHLSAVVFGDTIHVIGGRVDRLAPVGRVDILDPATETWSAGPAMGVARSDYALGFDAARGVAWVFGGEGDAANPLGVFATVERYDGTTWTRLSDMPRPRHAFGAATIGGVTYLPGGGEVLGFGPTSYHDAFTE